MPYRILFVCTGNTCRSPMAAALLKSKQLPDVEVKSAGVFAAEGSEASAHAKTVLKEKGIDSFHQASLLQKEHIDWATHVLAMTSGHKEMIVQRFPEATDKTFTLKQFASGTDGDIADPFGGSVDAYRAARDELAMLIDRLVEKFQEK